MIVTANQWFKAGFLTHFDLVVRTKMERHGISLRGEVEEGTLVAYVNRGRWIVKCECGGAEKVWEEGLFMCQSCFNSSYGHKFRHTEFPRNRKAIETLLERRPLENRNTTPEETVADLSRENREHESELLEVD